MQVGGWGVWTLYIGGTGSVFACLLKNSFMVGGYGYLCGRAVAFEVMLLKFGQTHRLLNGGM